ncbi:MAG: polysaccharide deacetylase family protein [Granulosicoccus sp.]
MSVVLMYHALYRDNDTSLIDDEDLPYAVSESNFIAQLDSLISRRVGVFDGSTEPEIVITFDDGHLSNLELAVPLLVERQMPAIFFVTTNFIGKRVGFMDSEQLKTLSETSGMYVGSHGLSHRFFDDMSPAESIHELAHSRKLLETLTSRPCQSISFPGGRYNNETLSQLQAAGYQQWFGSSVALVNTNVFGSSRVDNENMNTDFLLPQQNREPLSRVAVRRNTTLDEFSRIIGPDKGYYRQHRLKSQAKRSLRRIIGNRLYHGLYKSISAR